MLHLRVESPTDSALENLLRYPAATELSISAQCMLLERTLEWVRLADRFHYPGPTPGKITLLVDGKVLLETQRTASTQTLSTLDNRSASRQGEASS
jgi:hypothetical protein